MAETTALEWWMALKLLWQLSARAGWPSGCYLPTNVDLRGLDALPVKDATHDGTPMNSRAPNDAER